MVNDRWDKKSMEKEKNSVWPETYHIICQTWWRQCYNMGMLTGSLMFIDDVTADWSSRRTYEVYWALISAQIQPNALASFSGPDVYVHFF